MTQVPKAISLLLKISIVGAEMCALLLDISWTLVSRAIATKIHLATISSIDLVTVAIT